MRTHAGTYQGLPTHIERFKDAREMIETSRGRPRHPDECAEENDTFGDPDIELRRTSWRGGYKTRGAVIEAFKVGRANTSKVKKAEAFRLESVQTANTKLAVRKVGFVGGSVHMGRYLTGNPQCMRYIKREQVPSRIIDIGFDVAVLEDITPKDIETAGVAIMGVISRLESMGYRLRIHAMATSKCDGWDGPIYLGCGMVLKDTDERLNPGRVLFSLGDAGFFRSIIFGWRVRCPAFNEPWGMGRSIGSYMSADELKAFYKSEYGLEHVYNIAYLLRETDDLKGNARLIAIRDRVIADVTGAR